MDRERFEVLVGAMIFGLSREGTPSEVDEVVRRWDECKFHIPRLRAALSTMDAAAADLMNGDLRAAQRFLDERAPDWRGSH